MPAVPAAPEATDGERERTEVGLEGSEALPAEAEAEPPPGKEEISARTPRGR